MKIFFKYATDKVCVRRSVKVTLVVGTILAVINHYDSLFYESLTATDIFQISLTYLVPYSVATFGAAMQGRYLELERLKGIDKAGKP